MKRTLQSFIFFLVLVAQAANARQPAETLRFDFTSAQFRVNDSLNLAEFYFSVPRRSLEFVKVDSGFHAEFELEINIFQNDVLLHKDRWGSATHVDSLAEITPAQMLFSQRRLQMKTGIYRVEAALRDGNSSLSGTQTLSLAIKSFKADGLAASDLQIASRIQRAKSDAGGMFYKNGYEIIPNPSETYGAGLPALMFYLEVYNLTFPADSAYSVAWRVVDRNGEIVKNFPPKHKSIAGRSLVEVGGFNVLALRSGTYNLVVTIADLQSGEVVEQEKTFYVLREIDRRRFDTPKQVISAEDLAAFHYRDKSPKEVDEEFAAVKWIAKREDERIFKQLDFENKTTFLARFWRSQDPDSTTLQNEFRDDYLARVEYANENFGGLKPGWATDRGRILLIYNRPDEIERHPSNNSLRAYQIWRYYDLQGGTEFIFVDLRGWGEMELVHATARNEINDPDWERWLRPTGQ